MQGAYDHPRFLRYGDGALLVEFGNAVDPTLSAQTLAADAAFVAAIADGRMTGVYETSPSFRSVLLAFDPIETDAETVEAAARAALAAGGSVAAAGGRRWRLPVCFDPTVGLDLSEVSEAAGVSVDAVIELWLQTEWRVYIIGFLPGCPYLGPAPAGLTLPRRTEPRVAVPARSVAVAVGQSVVYPVESPGGWRILGRTPAQLFDPAHAERPTLFAPGDVVVGEPIDLAELRRMEAAAAAGEWRPSFEPSAPEPGEAMR